MVWRHPSTLGLLCSSERKLTVWSTFPPEENRCVHVKIEWRMYLWYTAVFFAAELDIWWFSASRARCTPECPTVSRQNCSFFSRTMKRKHPVRRKNQRSLLAAIVIRLLSLLSNYSMPISPVFILWNSWLHLPQWSYWSETVTQASPHGPLALWCVHLPWCPKDWKGEGKAFFPGSHPKNHSFCLFSRNKCLVLMDIARTFGKHKWNEAS